MLSAQRIYGSGSPRVRDRGPAEFGIDLRPTLPEDRFDTQPLLIADTLLVADLRLDNRTELLQLLGCSDADASRLADSAVLALAWKLWGAKCLDRIVGDFAIAAYCLLSHRLILARAITGQRPLHYAYADGKLAFASMPTGILAVPGFWHGFDEESLARTLLDIPASHQSTSFANIYRVPAGEAVTISGERVIRRRLWVPDYTEVQRAGGEEFVRAYREVLRKAVTSRMRRLNGPVAAHLSSGFDSSAVATTAALALPSGESLIALTAAPPMGFERTSPRGRIADESALAALTARWHGMRHLIVRSAEPIADRLRAQARLYQDPYRNLINAGWLMSLEAAAAENGASVLLAADLGNLTLNAGNLRSLADFLQRRGLRAWLREASLAFRKQDVRLTGILFNSFGGRLPVRVQQTLIRRFQGVVPKRQLTFLQQHIKDELPALPEEQYGLSSSSSHAERWQYLQSLDYGNIRKASFAETGVETRDPMADRRVIEFSTGLPPEQLLHHGISRPLTKAALADRVPPEVLHSRVRGYQAAHWTELLEPAALRELIEEISSSHAVGEILDLARMREALQQWPSIRSDDFAAYELYAGHLPQAIAVGLFIREYESRH